MDVKICQCKYKWPIINSICIACGLSASYSDEKRRQRPEPSVTMDQIADAVKFFIHGPNEVYIMAEEIAKKATDDDSNLPDPLV
jgi:hypothetical protein